MKSHKYWSLGALFCMLGCIYSGIKKSMTYSSLLCMGMSIYSGHKLVSPKKKITKPNNSENS